MALYARFTLREEIADLGDLAQASEELSKANWTDPRGSLLLGLVRFLQGRAVEARELVRCSYELDRHNPVTTGMLGASEMAVGNWAANFAFVEATHKSQACAISQPPAKA